MLSGRVEESLHLMHYRFMAYFYPNGPRGIIYPLVPITRIVAELKRLDLTLDLAIGDALSS
jgi:hypothetical protein